MDVGEKLLLDALYTSLNALRPRNFVVLTKHFDKTFADKHGELVIGIVRFRLLLSIHVTVTVPVCCTSLSHKSTIETNRNSRDISWA